MRTECLPLLNYNGSNMTGTNCDLFTHKSSQSYLTHLVQFKALFWASWQTTANYRTFCPDVVPKTKSRWAHSYETRNINYKLSHDVFLSVLSLGHISRLHRNTQSVSFGSQRPSSDDKNIQQQLPWPCGLGSSQQTLQSRNAYSTQMYDFCASRIFTLSKFVNKQITNVHNSIYTETVYNRFSHKWSSHCNCLTDGTDHQRASKCTSHHT
jgi:hypothetical protein